MREYDERVISAFLHNYKTVDIIRETGLSKTTVYKYKNDPEFQKVLQKRKDRILNVVVNRMQDRMIKDMEKLDEVIDNPESSGQVVVNAINVKWNHLREWITTTEILSRLEAVERTEKAVFRTIKGAEDEDTL